MVIARNLRIWYKQMYAELNSLTSLNLPKEYRVYLKNAAFLVERLGPLSFLLYQEQRLA